MNNTSNNSLLPFSDPLEVFNFLYGDKIIELFFQLKELTENTTILHRLRDSDQLQQFILTSISLTPYENYLQDKSDSEDEYS